MALLFKEIQLSMISLLRYVRRWTSETYASLLNWIQTSPSLRKISLYMYVAGSRHIMSRFLLAIANNTGIQHVVLSGSGIAVLDADAFASLLRSTRSKLKLELYYCGFHRAGDDAVAVVQDALRGNTSLQSLSIGYAECQVYVTLLPALSSCATITEIVT